MGACSSKPKTAEFEGNMNFHLQQELETRKHLDNVQKSECDAGSESIDLKIAQFDGTMKFYLQEEMARKNLEDDQKSIGPEQAISSCRCSFQNLQPGMENKHGGMGDMVLELEEECLAGSSLENNKKETCARADGICDAKHHYVSEGESLVPGIGMDNARVQNRKKSSVQELYEEPAFAQKEDVLGSITNYSVLCDKEVVIELLQKRAFGDAENGKFQSVENINEGKNVLSIEGRKPRRDAEEGNKASGRAIQEPVFLASKVLNVNFKLKTNSAGNLIHCGTKKTAACSASRAANNTTLAHNDKSRDLNLEKPSQPEGLQCGAQLQEALKMQSVPPTQGTEWTNLMVTPSNGSLAIREKHFSHVKPPAVISLPDASALSNGSLRFVGIKVDEFACIGISSSILKSTGKGDHKQLKKAHMATSMCDELSCHIQNSTELHLNTKVEDDSMAWNSHNEAVDMIPSGLKKGSKETIFVAETKSNIREALDSQASSLPEVHKETVYSIQEEKYASKQEGDLILCADETKVFEVLDMTKDQVPDYERHSAAASQPFKTFQELRLTYGKDMVSDIDEVLEKLASEFERQESLSSFLP